MNFKTWTAAILSAVLLPAQAGELYTGASWSVWGSPPIHYTHETRDSSIAIAGNAWGYTDYGIHRIEISQTRGSSSGNPPTAGSVTSVWSDTFTIVGAPGQIGESGSFIPVLSIDGYLGAPPPANSPTGAGSSLNVQASTNHNGLSIFIGLQNDDVYGPRIVHMSHGTFHHGSYSLSPEQLNGSTLPDTEFAYGATYVLGNPIQFYYGTPFTFTTQIGAWAGAGGEIFLGSTLRSSFLLPEGASIVANSGTIYSTFDPRDGANPFPVPEPGSAVLLIVGFGSLLVTVKRRRWDSHSSELTQS